MPFELLISSCVYDKFQSECIAFSSIRTTIVCAGICEWVNVQFRQIDTINYGAFINTKFPITKYSTFIRMFNCLWKINKLQTIVQQTEFEQIWYTQIEKNWPNCPKQLWSAVNRVSFDGIYCFISGVELIFFFLVCVWMLVNGKLWF